MEVPRGAFLFDHISLPTVLINFVALLFSLSVHEASHATAAYLLDDDTAARMGRMTINPIPHIDPIGTVVFPILGLLFGGFFIGWAKPVLFNPARLTRRLQMKVSAALIALAGPLSNILLAILFMAVTTLGVRLLELGPARVQLWLAAFDGPEALIGMGLDTGKVVLLGLGGALVHLNILLAAFNLVPLGPLDGAGVLGGFLPDHLQYRYNAFRYHRFWFFGLMLLMYVGVLKWLLYPTFMLMYALLNPIARLILGA
jgi:Zn-dependent protease